MIIRLMRKLILALALGLAGSFVTYAVTGVSPAMACDNGNC
jgi:hypothetical protein